MGRKHIEELAYQEYSNVRILIDLESYDITKEARLLIPFSHYQHYGLMNQAREVVVEPKYDRILGSCRTDSDVVKVGIYYTYGFNRVTKEPSTYLSTKWGLLDSKGNVILEPKYKSIGVSDDNKILTLQHMDRQYEVISKDGKVIVPKGTYPWIDTYDSGFARVNTYDGKHKKYGLIDKTGKEVLPMVYSSIWNFVNRNRQWITVEAIDEHGNKRIGRFIFLTRQLDI